MKPILKYDGQSGEKMRWVEINWDLCQSCDDCSARQVCKTRAIVRIERDEPMFVAMDRCNGCGKCILSCAFRAIYFNDSQVEKQIQNK